MRNDLSSDPELPQTTIAAEISPGIIIDADKPIFDDISALLRLREYHLKLTKKESYRYKPEFSGGRKVTRGARAREYW